MTATKRAPLVVTSDGEVPFVKPQRGVDPTATNHLATKGYVDGVLVGGGAAWGSITGTLSAQTDLQSALNAKAALAGAAFSGAVTFASVAPSSSVTPAGASNDLVRQVDVEAIVVAVLAAVTSGLAGKAANGAITASGLTMATARMLMRTTSGTGAVEEKTDAQVKAFLNISAADISVDSDGWDGYLAGANGKTTLKQVLDELDANGLTPP